MGEIVTARKYFGTDGIRGRVGEGVITPEFVLKLGWAAGQVLAKEGTGSVVIGKDTRISGYMFESVLEAGLSASGLDVKLLGPMPTPAIAYLTRTLGAKAGIVISASHNPYHDNGIKFFSASGTKLDDSIELQIEAQLEQDMTVVPSEKIGKAGRMADAGGRYIEFCKASIPSVTRLKGLKIVLDCGNGATYDVAPKVFAELGADVVVIGNTPNGININLACGSTYPKNLAQHVLQHNADLGIAFDGDGDRVIMVDHKGEVVDGDELLFIIARDHLRNGRLKGGVVGTLMSNLGLELALKQLGVGFVRSKVGDRYVMERLQEHQWILGGESSGHIICLDHNTTGDGVISALQVLVAMVHSGLSLYELKKGMTKMPQTMINVKLKSQDANIAQHVEVQAAVQRVEQQLADKGRVLLRPSGTEPVIRVMVEGEEQAVVDRYAKELAEVVENAQ